MLKMSVIINFIANKHYFTPTGNFDMFLNINLKQLLDILKMESNCYYIDTQK